MFNAILSISIAATALTLGGTTLLERETSPGHHSVGVGGVFKNDHVFMIPVVAGGSHEGLNAQHAGTVVLRAEA